MQWLIHVGVGQKPIQYGKVITLQLKTNQLKNILDRQKPFLFCNIQSISLVCLFVTPWTVACSLLCPWDFPGKNTGMGSHFLLHGIIPIQGSNPHFLCLPHCRQILYSLGTWERPLLKSFICIFMQKELEMTEHTQTHIYTYIFIYVLHIYSLIKICL